MDKNITNATKLANKIFGSKLVIENNSIGSSLKSQQQATLLRLEKTFTNISDNVYNIGGVFKAQLTSMEETRNSLRDNFNKEKLKFLENKNEFREYKNNISTQKNKQNLASSKSYSFDEILSSLQKLLDAAHSGYDLFDYDKKSRNKRKRNRKSSKAKIKAKFDPILKLGNKFVKKLPLVGIVLTVGEGLFKTLDEDDAVTESRGGPLASFTYNTADALIENLTFGLVDLKSIQETGQVLSGSEAGKAIAQKNREAVSGATSELDFMMGGESYQETEQPSKVQTRSLTVTETSEQRLKRLGITPSAVEGGGKYKPANVSVKEEDSSKTLTPSAVEGGRGKYKPANVSVKEEDSSKTLEELIEAKNKQYDKNIITTETGQVLVDSEGNPVRSSSLDDLIEESLKKEKAVAPAPVPAKPPTAPPPAPVPAKPTEPPTAVSKPTVSKGGVLEGIIETIKQAGISSYTAISNILSQIKSETNFRLQSENLNYSSAEQIQRVFGKKRFPTLEMAQEYVKNPVALANYAYKNTDGNSEEGDGWKYRGRGWIQHTGKAQYAAISKYAGVDLINNPDLLNDPIIASKALMWFFFNYKKLKPNDLEDISKVNRAIGFSDPTGKKAELRAKEAIAFQTSFDTGQNLNDSSVKVIAAKNQPQGTTIINLNNSNTTAVKLGAPQGSSTTVARPIT